MTDNNHKKADNSSSHEKEQTPDISGMKPVTLPSTPDPHQFVIARRLINIATIASPVSLFLGGGFFLSTIGVISAAIAHRKLAAYNTSEPEVNQAAVVLRRSSMIVLIISIAATIYNLISFCLILPSFLEAYRSGDFMGLGSLYSQPPQNTSSLWG